MPATPQSIFLVRRAPAESVLSMVLVGVNFPVAGFYRSAVSPAISTWPSFSKVAGWPSRGLVMLPVRDQVPVAGLYSSATGGGTFKPLPEGAGGRHAVRRVPARVSGTRLSVSAGG